VGTFHDNLGELHGITVVVDTNGDRVVVGRCHEVTDRGVLLHDADVHDASEGGMSKEDFVRRAAQVGVWAKHKTLIVPANEVTSVTRLGDIES
jgi:hypothetical protein